MNKDKLIKAVEERLERIQGDIETCKERIENSNFPLDEQHKKELSELKNQKEKLIQDIDKLKKSDDTVIDDLKIGIETVFDQMTNKIQQLTLKTDIQTNDIQLAQDYLKKYKKLISDYDIKVTIKELENVAEEVKAVRLIVITNTKTKKTKKYPAGSTEKQVWQLEFEKDLKADFFE